MNDSGTDKVFLWTRSHLLSVLTTGRNPVITDQRLRIAMTRVDRRDFVPEYVHKVYQDEAIDIGLGQKLDSPVLIAQMLNSLSVQPGNKVLDLGSGTGYVATILAMLVGDSGYVYSLERDQRILALARHNTKNFPDVNSRIEYLFKDGAEGLPAKAPFDIIHCAFSYSALPQKLAMQLCIGGRMVVPMVNGTIKLFTRVATDELEEKVLTGGVFPKYVPGVE